MVVWHRRYGFQLGLDSHNATYLHSTAIFRNQIRVLLRGDIDMTKNEIRKLEAWIKASEQRLLNRSVEALRHLTQEFSKMKATLLQSGNIRGKPLGERVPDDAPLVIDDPEAEDTFDKEAYLRSIRQEMTLQTIDFHLKALSIAASVFSQISNTKAGIAPFTGARPFEQHLPRTLKDFRESVDAVFKAAGLDKVEWE
ncbi:hypothetical protein LCGC14_1907060 [marine sediment metagenome]|uniref:Uncharacterized protein n=1 Tax=marine sediment metagenome TaxID=412755 RepID=A0A0F9FV93_9ZZZZ